MYIPFSHKVVSLIMKLISITHYLCKKREYTFIYIPRLLNSHSKRREANWKAL